MRPRQDDRLQLTSDKGRQGDLFIFSGGDVINKNILADMEHPFYSLSKQKDTEIREYHNGDCSLKILPGSMGMPTMYDKEIIIYCISKLVHLKNGGESISRKIKLTALDLFHFAGRGRGGVSYKRLETGLLRLGGVQIVTNIKTGDVEQTDFFGLIDSGRMVRRYGQDGRLQWVQVTLSEWIFNGICSNEVLSLPREYFQIEKMLIRRIYEIARKHCGRQAEWEIKLDLLFKKTGSKAKNVRHFRFQIEKFAKEHGSLLEYHLSCDSKRGVVVFTYGDELIKRINQVASKQVIGKEKWQTSFSGLCDLLGFNITPGGLDLFLWKLSKDQSYDVFEITFHDSEDIVYFKPLKAVVGDGDDLKHWTGTLSPHVFEQVQRLGLDIDKYELEYKWREWVGKKGINLNDPDAHFFSFCRRYTRITN